MTNIYIVGAGAFGCVMAERITTVLKRHVVLIDQRDHIGGNCYTFDDNKTGINCHKYGAHIFHTSNQDVYDYLSNFMKLNNYKHQVRTRGADNRIYSMPIGLDAINKFFNLELNPFECKEFLTKKIQSDFISEPKNLEEQAISLIGRELYLAFIRGYTKKQWQRDPKELPSYIIKRLPFRTSYDNNYFMDLYQGIPIGGYTPIFKKMLDNPLISLTLSTKFSEIKHSIKQDDFVIYTGTPDEYFDYKFGKLEWRTLNFEWKVLNVNDYQGCSVMNEASDLVPYTRTHEFKHFHPENNKIFTSGETVICREFSREYHDGDVPYYPVDTTRNIAIYQKYYELSKQYPNLIMGGRLGTYKYMDLDKVIKQSLDCFEVIRNKL